MEANKTQRLGKGKREKGKVAVEYVAPFSSSLSTSVSSYSYSSSPQPRILVIFLPISFIFIIPDCIGV